MSSSSKTKLIGEPNPKPDFEAGQVPLDWEKLKLMKKDQREKEIIRRANCITAHYTVFTLGVGFMKAKLLAVEKSRVSMEIPTTPLKMPSME